MIRKHENAVSWKAAMLAALVHLLLLTALFVSFNWKAAHTKVSVTEVELWDALPVEKSVPPPPQPVPPPEVKEVPKPQPIPPKPVVIEKPQAEDPAVEIALEKKKQEEEKLKKAAEIEKQKQAAIEKQKLEQKKLEEKQLEEKRKKLAAEKAATEKLKKLQESLREDALTPQSPSNDALKKLQEAVSSESGAEQSQAASAATSSTVDAFVAKIQAKVKGNVNRSLCGTGKPELTFKINVLPTGQLTGQPRLTKSSGNPICDDAVERAIMASEPLPLPTEPAALAQFRNMNLIFKPNE